MVAKAVKHGITTVAGVKYLGTNAAIAILKIGSLYLSKWNSSHFQFKPCGTHVIIITWSRVLCLMCILEAGQGSQVHICIYSCVYVHVSVHACHCACMCTCMRECAGECIYECACV